MRAFAVALAVAALSGGSAGASTTSSGLWGVVMRGPITPVCAADQPCDQPAANVRLTFVRGGTAVASIRTTRNGTYRLALAPGRYEVRLARRPAIGRGLSPTTVRVLRGRFSRVDFFIDTGIR